MNRSSEIKIIFKNQLTEELIDLIINFEYYHLSHIKRINGSIESVNDENKEIKYLKLLNDILDVKILKFF